MLYCHGDGSWHHSGSSGKRPVSPPPTHPLLELLSSWVVEWLWRIGVGGNARLWSGSDVTGVRHMAPERSAGVHGGGREHWTQSSSGCSVKVFKRHQQRDQIVRPGWRCTRRAPASVHLQFSVWKFCGSSLTDVRSNAAVYHFVVDSTGLAVNADFIFCDISDNTGPETALLSAVLEMILQGCLQNYVAKTKRAYVELKTFERKNQKSNCTSNNWFSNIN